MRITELLRGVGTAAALAAAVAGCSSGDSPSEPADPQPSPPALRMTMVVCDYATVAADSVQITIPPLPTCDSVTGAPDSIPQDRSTVHYVLIGDTLRLSLQQATPLIRVMTSGPSFSKDIAAFLDMLDTLDLPIELLAVLVRLDTGTGLEGQWAFADVAPEIIYGFLDSAQAAALASMRISADGEAVLAFDFEPPHLTGTLSRMVYGDGAVAQVVDTVGYGLTLDLPEPDDSVWTVTGAAGAGETVAIVIDRWGNMTYEHAGAAGYSTYTYYLWPEPQYCPNAIAPDWWVSFLAANPAQ